MATTCWQCGIRIRAGSPYCHQCGSAITARVAVEEPPESRRPRWHVAAATLLLFAAGLAILSSDSAPTTTTTEAAPPVAALASGEDRTEFQTLERATGTTAVVLTATSLELIDLDTAGRRTVPLGDAIAVSTIDLGRRLLLTDDAVLVAAGHAVWSFDLATADPQDLGPGDRLAPARNPANAWIWNELAGSWREVDESGDVVRETEPPHAGVPWDHGVGTPELTATPRLGIYELRADGSWQLIAAEDPVAGTNHRALTRECTSLENCKYRLIDVQTEARIEQPWLASLEVTPSTRLRLSPSGESLLEMKPTNRSWESVYVYTGVTVRPTACTQGWRQAVWSADETLLACVTDRGLAVSDVKNGPAALFDDWEEEPLAVVLAATDSIGWPRT